MVMRRFLCILILSACAYLVSCSQQTVATARSDGITCTLSFSAPLVANQSIPVIVQFTRDGQSVSMADVALDLQMPGMTMGSSRPMAEALSDGSHTANVLFTMDGEWSIVVTARSAQEPVRFVLNHILVSP
jgi:hypothetical protein